MTPAKRMRSKSIHTSAPILHREESDDSDDENKIKIKDSSNIWGKDDELNLIEQVKKVVVKNDRVKYKSRAEKLDWDKVAVGRFSADECKLRFMELLNRARKYRNLYEVLEELSEDIKLCPIKKPLTAYHLFIKDKYQDFRTEGEHFNGVMSKLAKAYKELPEREKQKYTNQASEFRKEYAKQKLEFFNNCPNVAKLSEKVPKIKYKTPYALFAEHQKLLGNKMDYNACRNSFNELAEDKKHMWITRAVEANQEMDVSKFLTKEEQKIFRGAKRFCNSYSLFIKENYPKFKERYANNSETINALVAKWKMMSAQDKQMYKAMADEFKKQAEGENSKQLSEKKKTKSKNKQNDQIDNSVNASLLNVQKKISKKSEQSLIESDDSTNNISNRASFVFATPTNAAKQTKQIRSEDRVNSESESSPKKFKRRIEQSLDEEEVIETPKKKNRAKSPQIMVFIPGKIEKVDDSSVSTSTPTKKKKKKKNRDSESSATQQSETETDVASSSATSKQKKKKKDKSDYFSGSEVQPPNKKPPSSLLKYYAENVYQGKPSRMEKSFAKLLEEDRKQLNAEYNEKVKCYATQLKTYLKSLPKEEAIKYKVKAEELEEDRDDEEDKLSQDY